MADHIKNLQVAQRELSEAVAVLGDRMRQIEADMAVLKAETKLDAIREAQSVVYAVQNGLNQRIEDIAVKVAVGEQQRRIGSD